MGGKLGLLLAGCVSSGVRYRACRIRTFHMAKFRTIFRRIKRVLPSPSSPWHSRIVYGWRTVSTIDIVTIFLIGLDYRSIPSHFSFVGMVLNSIFVRHRFGVFDLLFRNRLWFDIDFFFSCRHRIQLDYRAILIWCFVYRIETDYRSISIGLFVYRYRIEIDYRSTSIWLRVYRYRVESDYRSTSIWLCVYRHRTRLPFDIHHFFVLKLKAASDMALCETLRFG